MPSKTHEPARPVTPPTPESLFQGEDWIYDPVSATGIHRSDQHPCSCGNREFVVLMRASGSAGHVYCRVCMKNPRYRIARPGDVVYGQITIGDRGIRYLKDPAEMTRVRERLDREAAAARAAASVA